MQEGVEPVMQLQCRDRNRIALQSDLLGAAALGIPNVLLLTGDHPRFGDHPDAKPVFDLDSIQLVWTARTMREQRKLLSGRELKPAPDWFIGAVENPFAPPLSGAPSGWARRSPPARSSSRRSSSSTSPIFAQWMQQVRDLGLDQRVLHPGRRRTGQVAARAGAHAPRGARHVRARRGGAPAARRARRTGWRPKG